MIKNRVDMLFLFATGALFLLFVLNVLLGKAALLFEFEPFLQIGDVGEFLLLLAAVICFVIEILRRERQEADLKTKPANAAEEET